MAGSFPDRTGYPEGRYFPASVIGLSTDTTLRARERRLVRAADQPHPAQADAAEMLRCFRGQEVVERRSGAFKGPLAVAPVCLQSNRRIQALVTVTCLALLIFCLVERQVRRAIAPATMRTHLDARRPAKPTGRLSFQALATLRLIPATGTDPPGIPRPPPLQARLMELLNVDRPSRADPPPTTITPTPRPAVMRGTPS